MLQWVYWTPDFSQIGSYKITHVSPLVSPLVTTFFSKTGHEIILIFGMKLHIDSRKNVTEPFCSKILNRPKITNMCQKVRFLTFCGKSNPGIGTFKC